MEFPYGREMEKSKIKINLRELRPINTMIAEVCGNARLCVR